MEHPVRVEEGLDLPNEGEIAWVLCEDAVRGAVRPTEKCARVEQASYGGFFESLQSIDGFERFWVVRDCQLQVAAVVLDDRLDVDSDVFVENTVSACTGDE